MKWRGNRRSNNVFRAKSGGNRGGGRGFRPMGGLGLTGLAVVLGIGWLMGINPIQMLGLLQGMDGGGTYQSTTAVDANTGNDETTEFVRVIMASTEDVWHDIFNAQHAGAYKEPEMILYSGAVGTACGTGQSAMGPFYCPGDQRVYLDLGFFQELSQRYQAGGEFARAYVIAHEIGHHVQHLQGVFAKSEQARRQGARMEGASGLSVRQELQADCYAGVWASHSDQQYGWLEPGDIQKALQAASAIGDDRLQQQGQGRVVPDSFTHGTSEQRQRWFQTGFDTGEVGACDTFAAKAL